jgi:hypothetical protein
LPIAADGNWRNDVNWWLVGGVILIGLVGTVLYLYFVVRPRSTSQVTQSVQLLVNQTHGRRPDVLVPATCEATTMPNKSDVPGLGALAVTKEGVLFAAAKPDRVLIIPRAELISATVSKSTDAPSGQITKVLPMLVLTWQHSGTATHAAFTVPDPQSLAHSLNPATPE